MRRNRSISTTHPRARALQSVAGGALLMALLTALPVGVVRARLVICDAARHASAIHTRGDDPARSGGGPSPGQPLILPGNRGGSASAPPPSPVRSGVFFSPYKDVAINMDWNTHAMRSAVTGLPLPLVGSGSVITTAVPNLGAITLGFATGECGSESWGGVPGAAFARDNVPRLDAAGIDYVLSTGGQTGSFSCARPSGMMQFIARYHSPHLVGLDFDMETGQSDQTIADLIAGAKHAHAIYPNLRFSFTVATVAASDGSYGGVNALGDRVVRAVKKSGLANARINLMAFDFGNPSPAVCVVSNGHCDMGQSAVQTVRNLEHTYGLAPGQIEVTAMIGQNDSQALTMYPADVDPIVAYAVASGLAGIHYWSFDRDTPCAGGSIGHASPVCSSLNGTSPLEYARRFLKDLGR